MNHSPNFSTLLAEHAILSMEKQFCFVDMLTERFGDNWQWQVNLDQGVLSFTEEVHCGVQLLGTISTVTNTWLWAWANQSELPEHCLQLAMDMRTQGETADIPEFTVAQHDDVSLLPEKLAWIACGLSQANLIFWGAYEGGISCLLGFNEDFEALYTTDVTRVGRMIAEATDPKHDLTNHYQMITSYLQQKHYQMTTDGNIIRATSPQNQSIEITFTDQQRFLNMSFSAES